MTAEQMNAIIVVGELAGVASRLDVQVLEKYLADKPPFDFKYAKLCKAAIKFAKEIQK